MTTPIKKIMDRQAQVLSMRKNNWNFFAGGNRIVGA
jgi:hypothetical protein